jgi:uncharacterized membrane protein
VSWAAHLGWLDLSGTWLSFFDNTLVRWILTLVALWEYFFDQLPSTTSRTVPPQFAGRILTGALSGGAVAAGSRAIAGAMLAGIVGALIGTLVGHASRERLAVAFHEDRPAAFIEDAVAIGSALLIGAALH